MIRARLRRLERAAPARTIDVEAIRRRLSARLAGIAERLTTANLAPPPLAECSIGERLALGDPAAPELLRARLAELGLRSAGGVT